MARRQFEWCCAALALAFCLTSEAQSTIALTIEAVEIDEMGGSFSVRATPEDDAALDVGAYSLNLQFEGFTGELGEFLQFDTFNQLPLMNEVGASFGTTAHPGIVSEGDTVTYIAFGRGLLPPTGADLMGVSFAVPEGFRPGASFDVSIVPGPASTETFVQGFPLSLSSETIRFPIDLACDIDGNGVCDAADIDFLSDRIRHGSVDSVYDLDENGVVDAADRLVWVHDLMGTHVGDANLDQQFDAADIVDVFVAGEYLDAVDGNSGWATGDWNGDREFDTDDLVVAFIDGGYTVAAAISAVPEPNALMLFSLAVLVSPLFRPARAKAGGSSV